ncbi:MAG: SUMF1/EgtB/PvdO family nonheme iron enzyme [Phycisphaerales bacterium]|nr:SUMF1/EgtB/PvdO family nonheme iron enzyme [Phycisphaerales bacterium]
MRYTHIVPLASMILATAALANPVPPSYDFNWATIGDPGNRATLDEELGFLTNNQYLGSVNYEYRMATTEVTVGQYFEFAQVYHPYYTANTGNVLGFSDFTGGDIRLAWGDISIRQGRSPNKPIDMGWEYAARYVNWLHNGKVNEEWAFETGVYDTSTFTQNPDGSWNHQATRNPNATFWMATRDEWTKAGYWDPDLNNGEGGYHLFPNGSSEQSMPGTERNAGNGSEYPLDVGSFPDVMSPWGILDMEGGVEEWTGSVFNNDLRWRFMMGSGSGDTAFGELIAHDMLGRMSANSVFSPSGGIRLVSTVPSPSTIVVLGAFLIGFRRRYR